MSAKCEERNKHIGVLPTVVTFNRKTIEKLIERSMCPTKVTTNGYMIRMILSTTPTDGRRKILFRCRQVNVTVLILTLIVITTIRPNECYSFSIPAPDTKAVKGITELARTGTRIPVPIDELNTSATTHRQTKSTPIAVLHPIFKKPIAVYTIAGSDSGGGAGIQADLKTIHNFRCHGCSIVTCLTAQNSMAVTAVHTPPISFLQQQWDAIYSDIKPCAIKIGMLGSKDIVMTVGALLKELREHEQEHQQLDPHNNRKVWVVLDPVMISTSGSRLIDADAQQALMDHVFPYVDVVTPNLYEAQALLGSKEKITTYEEMEIVATKLIQLGCNAVLLKGGHFSQHTNVENDTTARDYLLIRSTTVTDDSLERAQPSSKERRLCDADVAVTASTTESLSSTADTKGVWIESVRYDTVHTHGTGCTLSSALASALAIGESARNGNVDGGANIAMNLVDATCLAKAYVTAGISHSQSLDGAHGPGPVAHTTFPNSYLHYPTIHKIARTTIASKGSFVKFGRYNQEMQSDVDFSDLLLSRVLPIVDSVEWIERLCKVKERFPKITINDVQLRIKNEIDPDRILDTVIRAQNLCTIANIRLWINDFWEAAIAAKCFGVHLGQEDLYRCINDGGIERMRQTNNMALGISTHTYGELSAALGIAPSYISLGPIFATGSKKVQFEPQGLPTLLQWRQLVPPEIPLIAIGGINDAHIAKEVRYAGADCIAVIGAVTYNDECDTIAQAILRLEQAMLC
jgi:hydroxymethylpyrimidine kinase / phosphomethylpyrimidine kinase / thiamine-phosphate diphosphorylase